MTRPSCPARPPRPSPESAGEGLRGALLAQAAALRAQADALEALADAPAPQAVDPREWLTLAEVQERFGIGSTKTRELAALGQIERSRASHPRRYSASSIDACLRQAARVRP